MPITTVADLDLKGKRVFVRVDFNVPLDENSHIIDDTRIRAALPTINYILDHDGIPILSSHLGRPKGKRDPRASLAPVAERLVKILDRKIVFAADCIGEDTKRLAQGLKPGDVMLLENTRFHPGEKSNDPEFAKELAALADLYVNDAFGAAHRAHASVVGVPRHFEKPAAGFLVEKEVKYLGGLLKDPPRPLVAIIGGAKVSTKMPVLANLVKRVEHLIIGGRMCFTFYKAKQYSIGATAYEEEFIGEVTKLLDNKQLYLPDDIVVAKDAQAGVPTEVVPAAHIPEGVKGVDIGPRSRERIRAFIAEARSIVWNGPLGIFEIDEFAHGTAAIAEAMAQATARGATTVAGGGETVAALKKFHVADKITHVSTGGGASLEFLEGKVLPGIEALGDGS